MSGSGYYKFRCKHFLTYNCGNWVWVNHSACAECVAAGRDEGQSLDGASPCEIIAPFVLFGRLVYEVVECEGGLPDEATVVARSRCHDNHEPESWNLETAAHVRPRHQH